MPGAKTNWTAAEDVLTSIDLRAQPWQAVLHSRWHRFRNLFRKVPRSSAAENERCALEAQISMARWFIELRRLARNGTLPQPLWPPEAPLPKYPDGAPEAVRSLLDLWQDIDGDESRANAKPDDGKIPATAQQDIVADYWNKWAFITWERAVQEEKSDQRSVWLSYVERYLGLANRDSRRDAWTPWQLNEGRLLLARSITGGNADELRQKAQTMLDRILGVDPAAAPVPPPTIDPVKVAATIASMATVPDAIAIASNLRRSYPGLSEESIRKVTELLAGKIPPVLLDQIFSQYAKGT